MGSVDDYVEKPTMSFDVSMGIYVYDPRGARADPRRPLRLPGRGQARCSDASRRVAAYTGPGVWFDIGTVGEHERATAEIEAHPELFEDA